MYVNITRCSDTPYISKTSRIIEFFVTAKGEKIEILYGPSSIIDREIKFISNAKFTIDTCMDYKSTSITLAVQPIKKLLLDAKNRNVRLRYITEITTQNISYCTLMKFTELRHLNGSLSNFMVSDNEYPALALSEGTSDLASQILYSNFKEIVERQKYIFDTLWNRAIPVLNRIIEIEDKKTSAITEVLYGTENAVARGIEFMKNVKERMDICFDSKAPSIVVEIGIYINGYEELEEEK